MRIQLLHTTDKHTDLKPGALGTVLREYTDPEWGEMVDVLWDSGSTLSLIWGADAWKILDLDVSKKTLTYAN